jgi:hypothetical protein
MMWLTLRSIISIFDESENDFQFYNKTCVAYPVNQRAALAWEGSHGLELGLVFDVPGATL